MKAWVAQEPGTLLEEKRRYVEVERFIIQWFPW